MQVNSHCSCHSQRPGWFPHPPSVHTSATSHRPVSRAWTRLWNVWRTSGISLAPPALPWSPARNICWSLAFPLLTLTCFSNELLVFFSLFWKSPLHIRNTNPLAYALQVFFPNLKHYILREIHFSLSYLNVHQRSVKKESHSNSGPWRKDLRSERELGSIKSICREFPGGPVVRTRSFHCRGPGFNPWLGN